MLTYDMITDEHIKILRVEEVYGDRSPTILSAVYNALCGDGGIVGLAGHHAQRETQAQARARCVEIWNRKAR